MIRIAPWVGTSTALSTGGGRVLRPKHTLCSQMPANGGNYLFWRV